MKKLIFQFVSMSTLLTTTIFCILFIQSNFANAEGGMILSNTNPNLAINAYGGAKHGTNLKLVNDCTPTNTDCTWTFRDGMILSNTNPNLAINAYGGAKHGTDLKLVNNCTPTNTDCTWTFRDGMILSNANPNLAINAYGGAKHGTDLKLVNDCIPTNTDCTWNYSLGVSKLETGIVYTNLGSNHQMWTKARLNRQNGHLEVNTRYKTSTWFGGYKGGAQIAFVDKDDFIIGTTHAEIHGVDGTLIGTSDRTVPWSENIPPEIVSSTDHMVVFQYWANDWNNNLNTWLEVGKKIGAAVAEVYAKFNGKAGSGT